MQRFLVAMLMLAPTVAAAQSASPAAMEIAGSLAISHQNTETGHGPYIDTGFGGKSFGEGVEFVFTKRHVAVGAELSTTSMSRTISGRVFTGYPGGIEIPGKLRETLFSVILGGSNRSRTIRGFGGIGWSFNSFELDGEPVDNPYKPPLALVGGVDVAIPVSQRVRPSFGFRYVHLGRDTMFLGQAVGTHMFRGTAGVTIVLR